MPIPITHLFRESLEPNKDIHCLPQPEDLEEMSLSWDDIDININELPLLPYPDNNSSYFSDDLLTVTDYVANPVNNSKFLKISDDKPFDLFKRYCHNNGYKYDFEYLDILNKQLSRLVLNLKFMYNRPRPKKYMQIHNVDFNFDTIEDNKSPSYPSGHSAHAYFNANMIAKVCPEIKVDLIQLADRIAQSRIDLGKHYPTDISFGRFLGELASKSIKSRDQIVLESSIKKPTTRQSARQFFIDAQNNHNSLNYPTEYCDELCEFIIQSNAIERYPVDISETYDASKMFLRGLPVKYCTSDPYVYSHLSGLEKAAELGLIDSVKKVVKIHKALGQNVLERGESGILRPFKHSAGTGYQFSDPEQILVDLNHWCESTVSLDAMTRHIIYECIHPFSDGNGRSGRMIMAADLNFDFYKLNDLIGDNYIKDIVDYQNREE